MAIFYTFDVDGAFIAADTDTEATCYAFPSSTHATQARRKPAEVAAAMMAHENACGRHGIGHEIDYDRRNWAKINASRFTSTRGFWTLEAGR